MLVICVAFRLDWFGLFGYLGLDFVLMSFALENDVVYVSLVIAW